MDTAIAIQDSSTCIDTEVEAWKSWLDVRIRRGKEIGLFSEVGVLTPLLAKECLARNTRNRAIRQSDVKKWESQIRSGNWRLTHQGISFDNNGKLDDGQHRCSAVVNTGQSIPMYFSFGEDSSVFTVLDVGAKRQIAHILQMDGEKNACVLAATLRCLYNINNGTPRANYTISADDARAVLRENPEIRGSVDIGQYVRSKLNSKSSPSGIAIAHYLLLQSRHAEKLGRFMDGLATGAIGTTDEKDCLVKLRDMLKSNLIKTPAGANNATHTAAAIINAWNRWSLGRRYKESFAWKDGREFPKVV